MQDTNTTATETSSETVKPEETNMLDAQALASQVQELTGKVQTLTTAHSSWNTWSVRFVAFTAVVAALYFVAQWMTNKKGGELSEVQAALIRAKDAQLTSDLKTKDEHIADANNKAADANNAAGQANVRAENLEHANLTLRGQVATLETQAADASKEVAGLQKAAADAKAAQQRVETELARQQARAANAEIALAEIRKKQEPRRLNWDKFVAALKGKPTARAEIMYQPEDPEAHHFAEELWMALAAAGWHVSSPISIPPDAAIGGFPNTDENTRQRFTSVERVGGQQTGVSVMANDINRDTATEKMAALNALGDAFLAAAGGVGMGRDEALPDNFFRIVVGPKP